MSSSQGGSAISDGAVERSVQTAKLALTEQVLDWKGSKFNLKHRLTNFLIPFLSTPLTVTGRSPAELFRGRQIRNLFTLLKPDLH